MKSLNLFKLKFVKESSSGEDEQIFEDLSEEVKLGVSSVLSKYGFSILGTEMLSCSIRERNYGQCEHCSTWVVNRNVEIEREDIDNEIRDGAEIESVLLCCDCLPRTHKWHWSNT